MSFVRASNSEPYVYFKDVMPLQLNRAHSLDDVRPPSHPEVRHQLNPYAPPFNKTNKTSEDPAGVPSLTLPELSKSVAAMREEQKEVTSVLRDVVSTLTVLKQSQKPAAQDYNSDVNQSNVNTQEGCDDNGRDMGYPDTSAYVAFPRRYHGVRFGEPQSLEMGKRTNHVKLPPFNGKDDWTVWVNRFEAISKRYGWSSDDKLDHLLPCIQGNAAHFVFTQLPPSVLSSYDSLIRELNSRYRSIQTARVAAAKFMNRRQKVGETAEEFASDLKRLYDLAHGYRDKRIRQEDLMRRFLDGLADEEISFQVEFHKEPTTIDDAVFHVVNYIQTRRSKRYDGKKNRTGRVGEGFDSSEVEVSDDEDGTPTRAIRNEGQKPSTKEEKTESQSTQDLLKQLVAIMTKQEEAKDRSNKQNRNKDTICFNCSKTGHFARNCPQKRKQRPNSYHGNRDAGRNKGSEEPTSDLN